MLVSEVGYNEFEENSRVNVDPREFSSTNEAGSPEFPWQPGESLCLEQVIEAYVSICGCLVSPRTLIEVDAMDATKVTQYLLC